MDEILAGSVNPIASTRASLSFSPAACGGPRAPLTCGGLPAICSRGAKWPERRRRFLRFLKACAARTGQLLNYSDLARDADTSVNTAKNWLSILQTSLQVVLLQPFHTNVTKRLAKRPKLYFLDTGLCAYLTEWSSPETLEAGAMAGAILETYVFAELLKSWWHRGLEPRIYYYRDKDAREIDFLLMQDRKMYPLEVKKSASPSADTLRVPEAARLHGMSVADGAVLCLCRESLPLTRNSQAVPVGIV